MSSSCARSSPRRRQRSKRTVSDSVWRSCEAYMRHAAWIANSCCRSAPRPHLQRALHVPYLEVVSESELPSKDLFHDRGAVGCGGLAVALNLQPRALDATV